MADFHILTGEDRQEKAERIQAIQDKAQPGGYPRQSQRLDGRPDPRGIVVEHYSGIASSVDGKRLAVRALPVEAFEQAPISAEEATEIQAECAKAEPLPSDWLKEAEPAVIE
jgi:hypothetical protein